MASLKYKDPQTGEWKTINKSGSYDANLAVHINNRTNPHKVTASQIGAYTKDEANAKFAPTYTYGTEDIEEGSESSYENGHIHFIYEP